MKYTLKENGEVIGSVISSHSMSIWELLEWNCININEMNNGDFVYDINEFEMEATNG